MVFVRKQGVFYFVVRVTGKGVRRGGYSDVVRSKARDWWLVKDKREGGIISLNGNTTIVFPKELVGKRVRFLIDVLD